MSRSTSQKTRYDFPSSAQAEHDRGVGGKGVRLAPPTPRTTTSHRWAPDGTYCLDCNQSRREEPVHGSPCDTSRRMCADHGHPVLVNTWIGAGYVRMCGECLRGVL